MQYSPLGHSDLMVSKICLGTMTWGEQNTEQQAHNQLDYATEQGVNFIDTAEMYPVPPMAQTYGLTEQYIGTWLKRRNNRDKVILASKVAGRADSIDYMRDGEICLDRCNIENALHDSLKRLQTDYIDLYQLHWPDRDTNYFGKLGFAYNQDEHTVPIEETLRVLADIIRSGKVRYIGLSNETPWGVMTFLKYAEQQSLPRAVSIQNPYSLLNRTYEIGLSEISHREKIGLLAYSPLGFGVLSGKYLGGKKPKGARLTLYSRFTRYSNPNAIRATQDYINIAQRYKLDAAQMSLAYVNSRGFLTSTIIGATTMQQLQSNIDSINITLSERVLAELEAVHTDNPNPSP